MWSGVLQVVMRIWRQEGAKRKKREVANEDGKGRVLSWDNFLQNS